MTTATVIKFLDQLFILCNTASFVLFDNAGYFSSLEFKAYLEQRGISSNQCSIWHLSGNGQTEKMVQTVWKTTQLAFKTVNLPRDQWEIVPPAALHSIRLLPAQPPMQHPTKDTSVFREDQASEITSELAYMSTS